MTHWVPSYAFAVSRVRASVSGSMRHAFLSSLSCSDEASVAAVQNGWGVVGPSACRASIAAIVVVGCGGRRTWEGRRYSYILESHALRKGYGRLA